MSSAAERGRGKRRCARCGRTGYNAFQLEADPAEGVASWVCAHQEPCATRRRARWRAGSRTTLGRPPSSPLLGWADDHQRACVIGAKPDVTAGIEEVLRELTPLEVDRLDGSPRSLARLSRGTYCVVVVDSCSADPLAYCNEISRRLSSANRQQLPVVICADSGETLRAPLLGLLARPNARRVDRPISAPGLVAAVADALGWSSIDDVRSA